MQKSAILFLIFWPVTIWSYPQFIGYGYTSCLTCHYNGHGSGPLNDYGRALWSSELSARPWSSNEEDLAATSGFLGRTQLPWWIRPGLKARGIRVHTDPGSSSSQQKYILMQADANLAIHFDQDANLIAVGSFGFAPDPQQAKLRGQNPDNGISREHYVRWGATKKLWVYAGMLDKVYGLRIVNHTSYSRAMTGLAQNDQAHGMILHYIDPSLEITLNGFLGNTFQSDDLRQKGASLLAEFEPAANLRWGGSFLLSNNAYLKNTRGGLQLRYGMGSGSALLVDAGLIENVPRGSESRLGYYVYSEAMQKIIRGWHAYFVGQAYQDQMKPQSVTLLKAGVGLLVFPMSRFEFRLELEDTRKIWADNVTPETFTLMSQIHISL